MRADLETYTITLLKHLNKTLDIPYDDLLDAYVTLHTKTNINGPKNALKKQCNTNTKFKRTLLEYIIVNDIEYLIDPPTQTLYTYEPKNPKIIGKYDSECNGVLLTV